jgi:hypothetical protein
MLVYTQTSPEIPRLMDRIDALAKESGMGYNLPIAVDQTDGYAWPWAWYLRHYHDVAYINQGSIGDFVPKEGSVLLIHLNNTARVDGAGYTQVPYKHRWWFNETYRGLTAGKVLDIATSWSQLNALGDFFLYRRPVEGNTGSTDAMAFFPESLSAFDRAAPSRPAAAPELQADGRIVFGRTGSGAGEMLQAADVFVDSGGTIWVADARSNRVHRFDASGNYIGSFGRGGEARGNLNQPWSLAVDAQGFIYVADTWNHRIEKFSPELAFLKAWGSPTNQQNPSLLQLYGPRDIAVAPDGTLWVTDTGHKRVIHYTPEGEPLGSIGAEGTGPGQFSEPVGLAIDAGGRLVVADAWNGRVQVIDPVMQQSQAIQVGWISQEVLHKPYVTVLADGRMLVSSPETSSLRLYMASGEFLGAWTPVSGGLPLGVAARPDGGFVFSDGRRNQVQIVPGDLLPSLFTR